jgi:hypothetical protein
MHENTRLIGDVIWDPNPVDPELQEKSRRIEQNAQRKLDQDKVERLRALRLSNTTDGKYQFLRRAAVIIGTQMGK